MSAHHVRMGYARSYKGAGAVRSGPYGRTSYADPGFQADGKPRYPIGTEEHVRAAWAYINQADNAGKYTPEQLKHVKATIRGAMRRHGIDVYVEAGKQATA